MERVFKVRMESEKYGCEEFEWDTLLEAEACVRRIRRKARELGDNVKRIFEIVVENKEV